MCFSSHFVWEFLKKTLILLRDVLGKTSWYSIDASGNDGHILLLYKKFHFCHLLPFAVAGQFTWKCDRGFWRAFPLRLYSHL